MPDGPLHGVRVLELGGIGPVPFAGMVLAGMGADVVCVRRPPAPDSLGDPHARGKRHVSIDLRDRDGAGRARLLAAQADVVLEGFRPGVAERLGLGPAECRVANERLVYGRMTGWGQHGPLAVTAGHDINFLGLTGALHAIGRAGQPPTVPLFLVGDLGGGSMYLVAGVLAALHRAAATGSGDVVDAAAVDGVSQQMTLVHAMHAAGEWTDARGTNLLDSGRPWYDTYETADGGWLAVGAIEDQFFAELVRLLDIPADLARREDPATWPQLRAELAARFASRTRAEWEQVFDGAEACVSPVLRLGEVADHPHLRARGTYDAARLPATAPRFGTGRDQPLPAPSIVHHDDVLGTWSPARPGGVTRRSVPSRG